MVRELLGGGAVNLDGPSYQMRNARLQMDIAAPVPVVIGTRSRLVSRLAGHVADAVVVGARELFGKRPDALSRLDMRRSRRGGPEPGGGGNRAARDHLRAHDGEQARRSVVLYSAHYLALGGLEQSMLPARQFERISRLAFQATGWYFEPDVSYPAELDALVGPEIIGRMAIAGTPAECLTGVKSLSRMGFQSVSMNTAAVRRPEGSMYQGLRETLEGLAEIVPQIHAL